MKACSTSPNRAPLSIEVNEELIRGGLIYYQMDQASEISIHLNYLRLLVKGRDLIHLRTIDV